MPGSVRMICGSSGSLFDLLAQLADIDAQILRVLGVRRPPDGGQDLLVRQDLAGMAGKEREQLEFLRRQLDLGAGACDAMANDVDLEIASHAAPASPRCAACDGAAPRACAPSARRRRTAC